MHIGERKSVRDRETKRERQREKKRKKTHIDELGRLLVSHDRHDWHRTILHAPLKTCAHLTTHTWHHIHQHIRFMAAARVVEINRRIKRDRVDNGSVRQWENAAKKFRFPFSGYIQTECDLLEPIIILKLVLILSYRWKRKKKEANVSFPFWCNDIWCDDLITFAVRCSIPWSKILLISKFDLDCNNRRKILKVWIF